MLGVECPSMGQTLHHSCPVRLRMGQLLQSREWQQQRWIASLQWLDESLRGWYVYYVVVYARVLCVCVRGLVLTIDVITIDALTFCEGIYCT